MIISRFSAMSVNVLLIFDMHDLNGTLFLKANILSVQLFAVHHYSHTNLILA